MKGRTALVNGTKHLQLPQPNPDNVSVFRLILKVVLVVALSLIVGAMAIAALFSAGSVMPLPNDEDLRTLFAGREEYLDELKHMSDVDSAVTVIQDKFTSLSNSWKGPMEIARCGLSEARWSRYCYLFGRGGISYGLERQGEDVYLLVASKGFLGGASKGYANLREQPLFLLPSLADDSVTRFLRAHPEARKAPLFRPLSDHWYLFRKID